MAERDRIQLGEPVAEVGVAEGNRNVVINQPAAAVGENGRAADQTRPLLLAVAGRKSPDTALVRDDAAPDLGVACADRVEIRLRAQNLGPSEWEEKSSV